MTRHEYINTLTTEQLKHLINTFYEILQDLEAAQYYEGEQETNENGDTTNYTPGFYSPYTGENYLEE